MKTIKLALEELGLLGLTWKQKATVIYFILSLCMLAIPDDSSILLIIAVIVNFFISALCVKKAGLNIKVD